MFARYASAVSTGTVMTLALLYAMQLLITLQPGAASDIKRTIPMTWLSVKIRDTPVQPEQPEITKEELAKTVDTPRRPDPSTSSQTISIPRESTLPPPKHNGILLAAPTDGALVNLVRVSPVYPPRALAMGLKATSSCSSTSALPGKSSMRRRSSQVTEFSRKRRCAPRNAFDSKRALSMGSL